MDSTEWSSYWEAGSHSDSQEISRVLWNLNIHYCVHKILQLDLIANQMNPVHIFLSSFRKMQFNIIISSTSRFLLKFCTNFSTKIYIWYKTKCTWLLELHPGSNIPKRELKYGPCVRRDAGLLRTKWLQPDLSADRKRLTCLLLEVYNPCMRTKRRAFPVLSPRLIPQGTISRKFRHALPTSGCLTSLW